MRSRLDSFLSAFKGAPESPDRSTRGPPASLPTTGTAKDATSQSPAGPSRTGKAKDATPGPSGTEATEAVPAAFQQYDKVYENGRQPVAKAVINTLGFNGGGTGGGLWYEVLAMGAGFLKFAPFPGLEGAARSLLYVWDSLRTVKNNRKACQRLTLQSASILMTICEDLASAGDRFTSGDDSELKTPSERLTASFQDVTRFLDEQSGQRFGKQYLQRLNVQQAIRNCENSLATALHMFSTSIGIRILALGLQQREDTKAVLTTTGINRGSKGLQPVVPPAQPQNDSDAVGEPTVHTEQSARDVVFKSQDYNNIVELLGRGVTTMSAGDSRSTRGPSRRVP